MQRQPGLWPEEEPNIWEGLDTEAKKTLIALLSMLIGKAVRPKPEEEKNK